LKLLAASCEESSIPEKVFFILLANPAASYGECARGDSNIFFGNGMMEE